jgi:large subunit ribosomal protein L25
MPDTTLPAETGRPLGSRAAGRLRAAGKIPGVLYGHGTDPLPIAVEGRALRAALSGEAGLNALLTLDLGGKSQTAMAKDIQRDPTRNTVTHVDFLLVNKDEVITADVPVVLVGEASAVYKADGVVDQSLFSLTVHAKPGDLPHQIEVDITDMEIGDAIRVDDLALPAGVNTDQDGETAIAVAQPPQAAEGAAEPEEGAEGGVALGESVSDGAAAGAQSGAEPPAAPGPSDAGDASPDA